MTQRQITILWTIQPWPARSVPPSRTSGGHRGQVCNLHPRQSDTLYGISSHCRAQANRFTCTDLYHHDNHKGLYGPTLILSSRPRNPREHLKVKEELLPAPRGRTPWGGTQGRFPGGSGCWLCADVTLFINMDYSAAQPQREPRVMWHNVMCVLSGNQPEPSMNSQTLNSHSF